MKWWYLLKDRTTFLCENRCVFQLHLHTICHLNCVHIFVPKKNMTVGQTSSVLQMYAHARYVGPTIGRGFYAGEVAVSDHFVDCGQTRPVWISREYVLCAQSFSWGSKRPWSRYAISVRSQWNLKGICHQEDRAENAYSKIGRFEPQLKL